MHSRKARGKNAHIRVFWDDTERQNIEFDNDEDHDVNRPAAVARVRHKFIEVKAVTSL